jgi:hypothetical protein
MGVGFGAKICLVNTIWSTATYPHAHYHNCRTYRRKVCRIVSDSSRPFSNSRKYSQGLGHSILFLAVAMLRCDQSRAFLHLCVCRCFLTSIYHSTYHNAQDCSCLLAIQDYIPWTASQRQSNPFLVSSIGTVTRSSVLPRVARRQPKPSPTSHQE